MSICLLDRAVIGCAMCVCVCYCWKMLRLKKWVRKAFLDTIYSCKLGKGVCPKCQQGRREIPMTLWSTPPCWQSADILDRPPLFATKNSVEKCFSHQFFLTRITFRDIFQWDFFLCVIFAINIIFLVKIIHLMTKWQFVGLKRGITGLKQAWYASTIKFLDCQLTLGPDPPPLLTPWWHFGSDPPSGRQLIYGWPLSKIRKVQLEARDIPLHAGIFGMDISACVFLQWPFENNQNRAGWQNVQNMKIQ